MKTKRALLGISIAAVILIIAAVSARAYYVTIAIIAGILIIGHREFWSLVRRRKLPPVDERVKENVGKSIRNGFTFLVMALAFLMLFFSINLTAKPDVVHVLGGLFLSVGMVYLLSYLFYDRAEPGLDERWLKLLRTFLLIAGMSLGTFIISVFLHNALGGLLGVEEPVFFVIAVIVSPLALAVGLIGSLVVFFRGLFSKTL